jgi:tetratricopeptide (TPR) repeat protein
MEEVNKSSLPTPGKLANIIDTEVMEKSPVSLEDPEKIYTEGSNLLEKGETEKSIEKLSKALEIATKLKGELDISLVKYYYTYADALIIQHEKENGQNIFGDAIPEKIPCSGTSSQSEESEQDLSQEKKEEETVSDLNNLTKEDQKNEENEKDSDSESFSPEESESEAKVLGEKIDDLEIAWECLESARVILKNQTDLNYYIKVIIRIGDLLSYKEEFEKSIEEYSTALQSLQAVEGPIYSRRKAELYFLIGSNLLQSKNKEIESAENFTKALENLEGVLSTTTEPQVREELNEIIKEVINKRDDALEQKQSINALKELENTEANQFDAATLNNIVDLGIIGKKKREPSEDPSFPEKNDDKRPSA